MKKAFTMIEIIFVIVILGILSSVAVSKMAVTRDDAVISKGRSEVAAIRNAISMKRNTNILMGKGAAYPSFLDALSTSSSNDGDKLFDYDGNTSDPKAQLLDYPIYSKSKNGWRKTDDDTYTFNAVNTDVDFVYKSDSGSFDCDHSNSDTSKKQLCKDLTE